MFAVLAAAVLFGTTGTSQALGPDGTTPLAVGAARLVIGGTALAAIGFFLAHRHRRDTSVARPPLTARAFVLMALTGVCLAAYQPLFFLGTARSGVAVGTVIALGSAPVMAGLIEWALTRRLPRPTWLTATALATTGVALLAFSGGGAGSADPLGVLGSLGAGAAFAVLANAQRRLMSGGWDPFTVAGAMGAGSALGALFMLPFATFTWLTQPSGIAVALWLGLATIALAYTLFTWGLQRLTAATAATLTLAEPVTATLLGLVVLGEQLDAASVVGIAVLTVGLVVLAWGSRRRDPEPFPLEG